MTDPKPGGRIVRSTLTELAEEERAAAERLECVARRGLTMDRHEIIERALASQTAHLSAAARLLQLVIDLRRAE